jgi:hypothetical protein
MPVTPFHFGPGLLLKSVVPQHFSWAAFAAAQVVIDGETLYFMLRLEYPVHRTLHTFTGATLAGLATAVALLAVVGGIRWRTPGLLGAFEQRRARLAAELRPISLLAGGAAGGISHPLLDAIMHPDVQPLLPWSAENPLLGVVGLWALHLGCVVAGLVGGVVLWRKTSMAHGTV